MMKMMVGGLLAVAAAGVDARPPLYDPVALNIGLTCQWQPNCISRQKKAMKRALNHVQKTRPPAWKIQLCNRNASRARNRVDWVGYHNCIRNPSLQPPPPPARRRTKSRR